MQYIKAELYYNGTLLTTSLNLNLQDDQLILKGCHTDQLTVHQAVEITLFSPKGIQEVAGRIDFIVEEIQVNIQLTKQGKIVDRREYLKVSTNYPAELKHMISPTGEQEFFNPPQTIEIKNISLGGLLFSSSMEFPKEGTSSFLFNGSTTPLKLEFSIVRVEEKDDCYYHGCTLAPLATREDSLLCNFIYQQQLLAQKKNQ